jgi:hypothetical protein
VFKSDQVRDAGSAPSPGCPLEYGAAGSALGLKSVGESFFSGLCKDVPNLESSRNPWAEVWAVDSLNEEDVLWYRVFDVTDDCRLLVVGLTNEPLNEFLLPCGVRWGTDVRACRRGGGRYRAVVDGIQASGLYAATGGIGQ